MTGSTGKNVERKKRRVLCGICPAGCWIEAHYDSDGRLVETRPDPDSELGMICEIGRRSAQIVYSPDRLRYPLLRSGPKGSHEFRRISWDQAFEIIVSKLKSIRDSYGPEATAIYTGRGSFELSECDVFQPKGVAVSSASSVLFPFGSPNTLGVGALCYVSFAMIAPHVTAGGMMINMFSDIENAELIVIWGANPATDCPPMDFKRVLQARQRGAEVVVIDPRRNGTALATEADWIAIRPGTDGALALGLCQVLIEEELYDENFAKNWTHGFDDLVRYCQHFRPEVVENVTGVPARVIRRLARRLASARGASPIMYSGLEYSDSGVQAIRATLTLWALAGQLDVPGGRCFSMMENQFPMNRQGHIPNPDVKKALGRDRFPVYSAYRGESHAICLPESVLEGNPYRIRSLIIEGGSIITAWPNPDIWRKTLSSLDFLVCIDRFMTADAAYADLVLPATTYYEIESYMVYGPLFRIRERVIDPVGEARHGFFILAELANRLGYGHLYPQTEEEVLRHALAPVGLTLEEVRASGGMARVPSVMMEYRKWEKGRLRPDGVPGFATPTGKFEIASTILEENGYDPLPVYTEPGEGPVSQPNLATKYPLVFTSGSRVTSDFRSQFHNVPDLLKKQPEPTLTINPSDAAKRNIGNNDLVEVITKRGRVRFRAYITDNIMEGVVDASMGGGGPVGPKAWQDCNVNDLTDLDHYDPISGFPVYKSLLCEVSRVDGASTTGLRLETENAEDHPKARITLQDNQHRRLIYMDHNATTPMAQEVLKTVSRLNERYFGNPSSIYSSGNEARLIIESSRRMVAQFLNCSARRIVFTGGGSEADNLAIKGVAFANQLRGTHVITSTIEHPAVLLACDWLEKNGFTVTRLPVSKEGLINPSDLASAITPRTILVSIMMANNETGSIQPITELARLARQNGAIFHTDAVQAVGKIQVDVEQLGIDLLTLSGHKIRGPKGVGVLYVRKGVHLDPLIHGGKQEHGLRAGTENVPGIGGIGKAAELAARGLQGMDRVRLLRDRLEKAIKEMVPEAILNGPVVERLPNTLNMTLPGMRGESVVLAMDRLGVAISSGSACRAGSPDPSHALLAMGLTPEQAHCSIRFSLGADNNEDDVDQAVELLGKIIRETSAGVRFVPCR